MFDNRQGREWAAFNIGTVDRLIDTHEDKIKKTRQVADVVAMLAGFALLRKRFRR